MAGREFGPPPNVVEEFGTVWRNWLYLLYKKVYKRRFDLSFQMTNSVGLDGGGTRSMVDGVIGVSPVVLGGDNKLEGRFFSLAIPRNYVPGTDIDFLITVINAQTQTGVKDVVTNMEYLFSNIGDTAFDPSTVAENVFSFPNNAPAGLFTNLPLFVILASTIGDKRVLQFEIQRDGNDSRDTLNGDIGYKELVFRYTGYINHE